VPEKEKRLTETKLRIGIIGSGRIGKVHAESLAFRIPEALPVAIADVHVDAAQEVAQRCGIARVVKDGKDILNDPNVDAVLICSPTETHANLIVEAARAGKHIFCEKPIDHSLTKIDIALQEVKKSGVKLQVGFNRRFDANFARVRSAVTQGEIGTPHLMHIISRDPGPPPISYIKTSGGIFVDMTIHDFDMARFLVGDEIESVYATGSVQVDPEIGKAGDLDTVLIVLQFKNGVIGTIDNSRKAAYGYDQRVEVFGSKGSIATGNCYPNQAILSTGTAIQRDLPLNFFMDRYTESFVSEMKAFVQAVLQNKPVPVDGTDGRVAVVMGLAARKSCNERRPVHLKEVDQLEPMLA
jgi:myo-inositol 2-dehydrogenase/D-chiro-inositol 1-dehydrogenase